VYMMISRVNAFDNSNSCIIEFEYVENI